jgi:hypothetical protein
MHTHTYIYNARGRLRWNSHVYWNVLQRSSESVCKRWPCSDHREHLENPSKLWRQLSKQGILEKLRKERKGWTFYTVANNWNPKYLMAYNRLRPCINPKSAHGHARNWPSCMRPCTGMTWWPKVYNNNWTWKQIGKLLKDK